MINTESVTDKQGCGYWPESGVETSQVVIGGEVLEVKKQSKGVPEQLVVQHYLAKLITRWLSIRSCKLDVYASDHPESFFYIQSANLILARLEFLKEMLYHLTNSGYSWPGVWRYLLLVWEGYMRPFGWLHKIRFDQTLIDAYHSPVPQLAMPQKQPPPSWRESFCAQKQRQPRPCRLSARSNRRLPRGFRGRRSEWVLGRVRSALYAPRLNTPIVLRITSALVPSRGPVRPC